MLYVRIPGSASKPLPIVIVGVFALQSIAMALLGPGAPVSTPVSWEELEAGGVKSEDFTLAEIAERVQQQGDHSQPVLGPGAAFTITSYAVEKRELKSAA